MRYPRGITNEEKFWKRVNKSDGCWNWIGSPAGTGHVQFRLDGRLVSAHRYSWFLATGRSTDVLILHRCNNPICVRPDHLYEGTQKDNMMDRRRVGWLKRDRHHGLSKL